MLFVCMCFSNKSLPAALVAQVCYFGPTEGLGKHFARCGLPAPRGVSAHEWALQAVSIDAESPATRSDSFARIAKLSKKSKTQKAASGEAAWIEGQASPMWAASGTAAAARAPFFVRGLVRYVPQGLFWAKLFSQLLH